MRHAREIDDDRLAADGLAEADRELGGRVVVVLRGQELAQIDLFARRVGQLDADGVAARHDRDARRERAHRARDVVGEPDHARRLDAGCGLELVERHHRPRPRIDDLAAHAEIAEHAFERGRVGLDRLHAGREAVGRLGRREITERGQLVAVGGFARRRARGRFRGLARRDLEARSALVVFVLVVLVVRRRPRHETRLDTAPRGRADGLGLALAPPRPHDGTDDARLEAQEAVHDPADRDRHDAGAIVGGRFFLLVVVILVVGRRMEAPAGRDEQRREGRDAEQRRDRHARGAGERAARDRGRQAQQRVAHHAAKAGRQRPGGGARQA